MPKITTKNKQYAKLQQDVKEHAKEIGVYEEIECHVRQLTENEAKHALIRAIHIMEDTLYCKTCPRKGDCEGGIAECERNILEELLARE